MRRITLTISDEALENLHEATARLEITQPQLLQILLEADIVAGLSSAQLKLARDFRLGKVLKSKVTAGVVNKLKRFTPEQRRAILAQVESDAK